MVDVMVVGAHPDDIEIGMGATVARFVSQNKSVVMVDLSDGEPTPHGTHKIRLAEAAQSAKVLGVTHRVTMDLVNREIVDTIEARKKLAVLIRQYQPKVLFVPYWDDGHPDHIAASALCMASRFYAKFVKTDMPLEPHYPARVYHYLSNHLRLNLSPSFIVGVSPEEMAVKVEALSCYRSQFVENDKNSHVLEAVRIENAHWGRHVRRPFGEPFICKETLLVESPDGLLYD